MKHLRRTLCVLLVLALLCGMSVTSFARVNCTNYSSWFEPSYNEMNELGLIPESFSGYDLKKNITRGEMTTLAVHIFEKFTGNSITPERTDYFTDTQDPMIIKAYELGIVGGYPDGTFRPNQNLTRQEFFKIIENFCYSAAFKPTTEGASLSSFQDNAQVADWAVDAAQICVKYGYVTGTVNASGADILDPKGTTTRQEGMAMLMRCYKGLREYYYYNVLSAGVVDDYVDDGDVTVSDVNKTLYVTASTLNMRDSWSSSSTQVGTLSYGEAVTVTGECSNGWYRISHDGHTAYVSGRYLSSNQSSGSTGTPPTAAGSGTASEIANFVLSFVGYSYVYGGSSPSTGFDCSGLMYYCLRQYGYSMNRVADDQMDQGTPVSRDELQVGDLVFFGSGSYANHVGMYIGGGNFVHASTPSTGVRVNALDETYYSTRFIGARRII